MSIIIPTDKPTWESEIAIYWFMDNGILVSLSKSPERTIENIKANVELVKIITKNKPVPLLIYMANSPIPGKAVRKLSGEQVPVIYKAMAMVSKPGLAKFVMNMVFALKPPPIPMKSFTDDKEAVQWLTQYI